MAVTAERCDQVRKQWAEEAKKHETQPGQTPDLQRMVHQKSIADALASHVIVQFDDDHAYLFGADADKVSKALGMTCEADDKGGKCLKLLKTWWNKHLETLTAAGIQVSVAH